MQYYIKSNSSVDLKTACKWLASKTIVAVDTETEGLDILSDKILLLQIGDENDQFVFDAFRIGEEGIKDVLKILNDPTKIKVFHNAKFDYSMIKRNYEIEINNMRCTMLADQLLTAGKKLPHNLKALLDKYLNVKISKEEREGFFDARYGCSFTKAQINYAAIDTEYLIPLYKKIQALIEERDMKLVAELECLTIKVTADMELNGIKIDVDKWLALKQNAYKRQLDAQNKLNRFFLPFCDMDLFGMPVVNYNSPPQMLKLLSKITEQELESTNENYIKYIDHPVIKALLDYRGATKLVTTYGQKFLDDNLRQDGRIHTVFNQHGADTGRYSSKNPKVNWGII